MIKAKGKEQRLLTISKMAKIKSIHKIYSKVKLIKARQ